MCGFLKDRLHDIWPLGNLESRSLIAKLNLVYWILLPEVTGLFILNEFAITTLIYLGLAIRVATRTRCKCV